MSKKESDFTDLFKKALALYEEDPITAQLIVVALYRVLKKATDTVFDEGILKYLGMHFMDMPEDAFADKIKIVKA